MGTNESGQASIEPQDQDGTFELQELEPSQAMAVNHSADASHAHSQDIDAATAQIAQLETQYKAGVNWMFFIAMGTLVNTILIHLNTDFIFFVGLSSSAFIDSVANEVFKEGGNRLLTWIAIGINAAVLAGWLAVTGLAYKRFVWVMLTGVVLFVLDSLVTVGLLFIDPSIFMWAVVHAIALYYMVRSFSSLHKLNRLDREVAQMENQMENQMEHVTGNADI